MSGPRLSRRDALRAGSVGLLGSMAGCAGVLRAVSQSDSKERAGESETVGQTTSAGTTTQEPATTTEQQSTETTTTDQETTTTSEAGGGGSIDGHPGTAGLDSQPMLGADLESSNAVIVAYEDPSCPYCRKFEQETFPEVKRKLLDTEKATFVFRGLGIVKDWGAPTAKALEATYEESAAAHWALKTHYYDQQHTFKMENALSKTKEFLEKETAVDGEEVIEAVEEGDATEPYQVDMQAARSAEVTATPTFLLFRDGRFVTSAVGAVSYEVLATPLGL